MTTVGKFRESARSPGSPNAERGGYWRAEPLGQEHSFALNAAPRSRFEPDHLSSSPEQANWVHAHHLSAAPKKVFARLCKNNPYIGFFHYAPSAGNRSRSTYFEQDIVSMEVIHGQHAVRSNPMIGNLHYGHDLYGERFEDFQRILAQLKAKDVERQVQAVLDRHPRPFGGGDLSPGNASAIMSRRSRGRSRSITESDVANNGKRAVRSSSAGKAAIMRVAAAEEAAVAAAAAAAVSAAAAATTPSASDDGAWEVGGSDEDDDEGINWHRTTSNAAMEALEGDRGRGLSDAIREEVQRSFDVGGQGAAAAAAEEEEEERRGEERDGSFEEEDRRRLREKAFAIVVYASGDSLVKLVEKERRNGMSTKRFKYAGAIDASKCYPKSGSLDDCALLRPFVAERSRLYNDLIAEVNGFRRHFFLRQKMHPKEAYRQHRRKQEADSNRGANQELDQYPDEAGSIAWSKQDSFSEYEPWIGGTSYGSMPGEHMHGPPGGGVLAGNGNGHGMGGAGHISHSSGGGMGGDAGGGGVFLEPAWPGGRMGVCVDDGALPFHGAPPFHTLVGPGQFARVSRERSGEENQPAQPGDAWMPGTVSAQRTKESWRSKQEMRDCREFKPFFVQAKTDFTATYRLLDDCRLGEGAYASVFLAEHLKRGEDVAVKAVQKRLLFSDAEKKSVGAEIDNQLRIVHKHIVRLYEVYETPDKVFIVLENCPCGDLEKMLYLRGRLTEIEAKRVIMQLLEGVSYLHSKGIVHCDIKPQNLLFAPDPDNPDAPTLKAAGSSQSSGAESEKSTGPEKRGKQQVSSPAGRLAKLCDFGISCKVPDVRFYKQTGDINKIPWSGLFGTGGYIAPEIMSQQPFGKPADLWSVGVMLYQMISGRLPFIPARKCVTKPVSFPAAVWADVNVGVKSLIEGLLEKEPSQRLTAAQALQHPWVQTIHHLRPSFPHFVPKPGSMSRSGSTGSSSSANPGHGHSSPTGSGGGKGGGGSTAA
ncbi:unnamed protein product [Ectocarpus sp. 6 AP-2014]